jgi:hypothetical protein
MGAADRPELHALKPADARKLARDIMEHGSVRFTAHAQREMKNDDLETTDCVNVLRGGVFSPAEFANREWRYRVATHRICVVVTFESPDQLAVITAWRIK